MPIKKQTPQGKAAPEAPVTPKNLKQPIKAWVKPAQGGGTDNPAEPTLARSRVDWDAVERDFRMGKFTLRELGAKYHVSHAAIGKKSRDNNWQQDLTLQIKQATNAKLTESLVSKEVDSGFQAVSTAVQIAAEVNKQIIIGHRIRLQDLAKAVDQAKDKLMVLGEGVADIREAAVFVQAVGSLSSATKTLIDQERKAFGLDDGQPETPADKWNDFIEDLSARGSRLPTGANA